MNALLNFVTLLAEVFHAAHDEEYIFMVLVNSWTNQILSSSIFFLVF